MIPPVWPSSPADCLAHTATEWGSSRESTYRRCNHEHYLRYHRHLRPIYAPASEPLSDLPQKPRSLQVGILVHAGLHWQASGPQAGEERDPLAPLQAASESFEGADIDEAARLLEGYVARWGSANAGWPEALEIVAVEQEIVVHHAGFSVSRRADLVLRNTLNDRILTVDHKTRQAKFQDDFEIRWNTKPQWIGQSWAVREAYGLDYYPDVIINGLIKTKLPKYDRKTLHISESAVAMWLEAREAEELGGLGAQRNLDACVNDITGRSCDFYEWCHGSEALRRERFEVKGDQGPHVQGRLQPNEYVEFNELCANLEPDLECDELFVYYRAKP